MFERLIPLNLIEPKVQTWSSLLRLINRIFALIGVFRFIKVFHKSTELRRSGHLQWIHGFRAAGVWKAKSSSCTQFHPLIKPPAAPFDSFTYLHSWSHVRIQPLSNMRPGDRLQHLWCMNEKKDRVYQRTKKNFIGVWISVEVSDSTVFNSTC